MSVAAASNVASQLVLHPLVSQNLKLLSNTAGRDKLYRAIQFFARLLAWVLIKRGYKLQAARWNALKAHIGLSRKLFSLGRPAENLQTALRLSQAPGGEPAERIAAITRHLAYFGYLSYDALGWAHAVKFYTLAPETAARVARLTNRFWLAGILASITHGLLKAGRLANEVKSLQSSGWTEKNVGGEADRQGKLRALEQQRAATRYQFIMDLLDIWIPTAGLGLVNLNDGVVGALGMTTSIMSLQTQWANLNARK